MYIDDINCWQKWKTAVNLKLSMRIYRKCIGMEFGIENYSILITRSGKWYMTEGVEQQNQEKIRMLGEKETFKYLGILKADTIKQVEIKLNEKRLF